jgi:putative tryptophan/tyrosine transport system substrate-binding protein
MRRRDFLTTLGGVLLSKSSAAQQSKRAPVVGILDPSVPVSPTSDAQIAIFKEALREIGWVDGKNVVIERRKVGSDNELTKREATNLVGLGPAVLVGSSTVVAAALAERTKTIPIVFVGVAEPIGSGFTDSLSKPSRNLTGFTVFDPEMGGKLVQLLKEIKPSITKVTALFDLDIGAGRHVLSNLMNRWKELAQSMDLDFEVADIKSASDIEQVFSKLGDKDAIIVAPDTTMNINVKLISQLAESQRVPAIYSWPRQVRLGGLMSYSVDTDQLWRNTASYVGQLLAGANISELPVQQPTRFMLSLNLATAKRMELTMPRTLLTLAHEVYE